MSHQHCLNHAFCRLITHSEIIPEPDIRERYITTYCESSPPAFQQCRRFRFKVEFGFCPDFVLPDDTTSNDGILDRFEEE